MCKMSAKVYGGAQIDSFLNREGSLPPIKSLMLWNNLLGQVTQTKNHIASDCTSEKNNMAGCDSRCLDSRLPLLALSFTGLKRLGIKGASHGIFFCTKWSFHVHLI